MRSLSLLLCALAGAPAAAQSTFAGVESLELDNGMTVLLLEDHGAPKVALVAWVRAGSRDELAGRTGFAHLFEHIMFKGTPAIPDGRFDALLEAAGGFSSAFTTADETVYHEDAASNFLETMLWLEADRLATLVDEFDEKKLDNQRDVVRNERRQSIDNRPYGKARPLLQAALWPEGHGYHWLTIGSHEDLVAARVEDVKGFFRTHYVPANIVAVIAGDFERARARALAAKYLGAIPARPAPARRPVPEPPPLTRPTILSATDDVQAARVQLAWRAPRALAADEPAAELAALILGEGKGSRLYERLVYRERLAQDVSASFEHGDVGGRVEIVATAKGAEGGKMTAAILEEVARLGREAPTAAELERARNLREATFLAELEPLVRRAIHAAEYQVRGGKPDGLAADLARYRAVDPDAVRRAAARHLAPASRVEVTIVPEKRP